MTFPKYPEYKDSGVESVGKIPSHWTPRRIRSITSIQKGKLPKTTNSGSNLESDLPYLTMEYLRGNEESISSIFIPVEDQTILANEGDILVLWDGSNAGEFLKAKKGVVSSTLAIIKNLSVEKNYLFYGLKSFEKCLKDQTIGMGIPHVSNDILRNLIIYLPSDTEQKIVVKFLNHETTKIDSLIAEQEKLIKLLKEKRQAVISNAVTKGLDPNVKMKDTGNPWLNQVPESWKIGRLKHIKSTQKNSFVDGPFGSNLKSEHFIEGGDVYVIESNFATQGILEPENLKTISFKHFETISRSEVRSGDIVIAKIGAQYGKSSILPDIDKRAVVSGNSLKLTVNPSIADVNFVNWFLVNLKSLGVIEDIVNATAQPALSLGELNNLPMLIPSLKEQQLIVGYLVKILNKFQSLIDEANINIELLKERRSALISAAVTGQIDVRDYYGN